METTNKKNIGLDFALLIILFFNFVFSTENWHYLSFIPIQGSPKNFFFFYLACLAALAYFIISFLKISDSKKHYFKLGIIIFLIFTTLIAALVYQIYLRENGASILFVHDGAIGTEVATDFLAHGKNPYHENYQNTIFGQFPNTYDLNKPNPAWFHYIYLPFLPLFSLPFYKIFNFLFSFYDQRIVYGLITVLAIFLIYRIIDDNKKKILAIITFAFNPLFFPYLLSGYNDIFVYFWILLSLYLLKKRHMYWSTAVLALACASKQQAFMILPFYLAYLYFREDRIKSVVHKMISAIKKMAPFLVVSAIIFIPFLAWNFNDFIDDTVRHPAGTISTSLPMIGHGISYLVYLSGFVKTIWDYFPFWIFQTIFGLPLLYFLIKKQRENNSIGLILYAYGVFLMVWWFFSRFFNDNYISYLSMIFLTAYFTDSDKKIEAGTKNG